MTSAPRKKRLSPQRTYTLTPDASRWMDRLRDERPGAFKNASDRVSACIEVAGQLILDATEVKVSSDV